MTPPARSPGFRPRIRLWMKLAAIAAIGVTVICTLYFYVANRVSMTALAEQQGIAGQSMAKLVAQEATDAVLVDDAVSLYEIVHRAATHGGLAYCFIVRDGRVLASSLDVLPPALVDLRQRTDRAPLVVRRGPARYLDVVEPILDGAAGAVRLGLDLEPLVAARRRLAGLLGVASLLALAAGLVAALLAGRRFARPIAELVRVADSFDPSVGATPVSPGSSDEIGELAERFNRMMVRLQAAHREQEQARQKNMQTERLATLGSLVAGVAHEVNNPLAGLKNCHRVLARDDLPPAKREEYLALMQDALERIEEIVHRLLDFGRPRSLRLGEERIEDLARESLHLVRSLLARRRIAWREDFSDTGDRARVIADRKQVGQALLNLILNAAYVTPDGGAIRVRTRRRPDHFGIAVEDDGPGVPPALRERIFDPFFTTKPEGEGTGLGLAVTRTIVAAHGGELALEFPPPRGTVATIWLREASAGSGTQAAAP